MEVAICDFQSRQNGTIDIDNTLKIVYYKKEGGIHREGLDMKNTVKFKDYLKEELKNKEFKKAFNEEEVYASLAIQTANIRQEKGITQEELAKRLRTTQQTVSRLEDIHNKSYSLKTLIKLARALDKGLKVEFV